MRFGRAFLLALLLPVLLHAGAGPARAADPLWSPRIAVVWPHDGHGTPTPLGASRAVNISVWPANQVACDNDPRGSQFDLRVAKDNEPYRPADPPSRFVLRTVGGVRFPAVEYENVPADLVAEPGAQYRFFVGPPGLSNIWTHAIDPRTLLPEPVVPTGYRGYEGGFPEARVQVVWPHDGRGAFAPVGRATHVNVAVDVFVAGTTLSFPPDYNPQSVGLSVAVGNGQPQTRSWLSPEAWVRELPEAEKTTYQMNGRTYPRWVFNNVPVRPGERYQFLGGVFDGKIPYYGTNIWTHAADARTLLPRPQVPPACAP